MDVFRLLKQDHKEVRALFKQLRGSKPSKAREKAMQQLHQALSVHIEVEEQLVYPRLREEKRLREAVGEAFEEHHVAKLLLAELVRTSMDDERWDAKLSVLKELVEHHLSEEEEEEVFPKASKALGKDEAKTLGQQAEEAKKERMKSMRKRGAEAPAPAQEEQHASA